MEDKLIKIACVGDSITYGQTLDDIRTESYPAVLEKMLNEREEKGGEPTTQYRVCNFGVSGSGLWRHGHYVYTSTSKYQDAISWGADIIVICLGSNDTVHMIDETFEEEFIDDYAALVSALKTNAPKAQVYIARIPPIPCYPSLVPAVCRINGAIHRAAEKCGATLIDFMKPFLGKDDLFSDGIHPNKLGAQVLASTVYHELVRIPQEPEVEGSPFDYSNLPVEYTAENLFQIDERRTVHDEDEAMTYLNSFWNVMEKPRVGFQIIDPNDLRTLFRKQNELILLPTVREYQEEDLAESTISVLSTQMQEGDVVLLTFATTEDDWRLEGILYENFNERISSSFGSQVKIFFGAAIPDEHQSYTSPLQVSIMILRCGLT